MKMAGRLFILRIFVALLLVLVSTTPLLANAGSFFLIPAAIQLLIGNILLGVLEAFFIQRFFKTPKNVSSYGKIVLANYASMILGYVAALMTPAAQMGFSGYGLFVLLAVLFAASVFAEWPFFSWAVNERFLGFSKKTLKYSFAAQCVSYALLIPMYFLTFDTGYVPEEDRLKQDLAHFFADAYDYRKRPSPFTLLGREFKAGAGAYTGYEIPGLQDYRGDGIYSARVVHPDTVEFVAHWMADPLQSISAKIDSTGKPVEHSWVIKGDFDISEEVLRMTYQTSIRSLAVSDSNLFAGTSLGIFLSTDRGTSWTSVNNGLTSFDVYALAVSGPNVFAGTRDGVFRSTNNGASWASASAGLPKIIVIALAVSNSNLFAATTAEGVFRSTDSGTSWTVVNTGLTSKLVNALAVSGASLFAGTNGNGVFRSTNNGSRWTRSGLPAAFVNVLTVQGKSLFAGLDARDYQTSLFFSPDNGASWRPADFFRRVSSVNAFAVTPGTLIAGGTNGGLFLSTNSGTTWIRGGPGVLPMGVRCLAASGTSVFAASAWMIFHSTDNGLSWTTVRPLWREE